MAPCSWRKRLAQRGEHHEQSVSPNASAEAAMRPANMVALDVCVCLVKAGWEAAAKAKAIEVLTSMLWLCMSRPNSGHMHAVPCLGHPRRCPPQQRLSAALRATSHALQRHGSNTCNATCSAQAPFKRGIQNMSAGMRGTNMQTVHRAGWDCFW